MSVEKSIFGKMPDGSIVELYQLTNKNGIKVSVITHGGIITKIEVPDKNGDFDDVVLGIDLPHFFGPVFMRVFPAYQLHN